jgi:16S rRNA (cytidine1402-2'-O)-methyltransferase
MGESKKVCVVREISKIYEEFKRGTAIDVKNYYVLNPPKGEIVLIIEGKS